jgi:hypothetical protein
MKRMKYTDEHIQFLKENTPGKSNKETTQLFNKKFKLKISEDRIKSLKSRYKIISGVNTQFKKGNISHNKGKKGYYTPGSEKGWFKKGNKPKNTMLVGTELMKADGYVYIKVEDPNVWKQKHKLIWEKENGPYSTKTHVVIFKDGNRDNFTLDNLQLITRKQLAILNRNNLLSKDKDLTETGLLVGKIIEARARRRKNEK